jgi:hypothetical protein
MAAVKTGTTSPTDMRIGGNPVQKIYLGSALVFVRA